MKIIKGQFVSVWDDGSVTSYAELNLDTGEVINIEPWTVPKFMAACSGNISRIRMVIPMTSVPPVTSTPSRPPWFLIKPAKASMKKKSVSTLIVNPMRSNYAQDSLYPGESRKVLIQLDSFTMDLPAHISLEEQNDWSGKKS
jgi:hypothetical protein